jgi:hypothetical protein
VHLQRQEALHRGDAFRAQALILRRQQIGEVARETFALP